MTFPRSQTGSLTARENLVFHGRYYGLDRDTLNDRVDVQSRNAIWQQIRHLADRGRAVLLTTNYMDEAEELADTILLIDQGREVVSGTVGNQKGEVGRRDAARHVPGTGRRRGALDTHPRPARRGA